jgi:uncharacterized protein
LALVLDTGPLLAALDAHDPDHEACRRLIGESREDLIVPTLVLGELDYWCTKRLGAAVWSMFFEDVIEGAYVVEAPTFDDLRRCRELSEVYSDLAVGLVDASVLALVERIGEAKLATLDHRHFRVMRPRHLESIRLLPADG